MTTLLIRGATLIDLALPLERADLLIEGDRIARVEASLDVRAERVIEATGSYLIPGLIDAHSHSTQTFYRGFVDNLPLELWLPYIVFGSQPLTPRQVYVAAAVSAIELLKSGTTSVLDHGPPLIPDFFDAWVDAAMAGYRDVGMRAVVAPIYNNIDYFGTLYRDVDTAQKMSRPGWPQQPVAELVGALSRFLERWHANARHPRLSCMLGPGSPQGCTLELLEASVELARRYAVPLHTHLLEVKSQRLALERIYGESALAFLERIGFLGPTSSIAHGVWLTPDEIERLADTRTAVVHNAVSNLKLGSGVAPVQEMLAQGVPVALGGDGAACNDSLNMFDVVKTTALIHKLYGPHEQWLSAEQALSLCWAGGADVLRQEVGAIRPGFLADLVLLDGSRFYPAPKEQIINQLVYGDTKRAVRTVIVGGEVVVESGRVIRVDEEALWLEAREVAAGLYARLPERKARWLQWMPSLRGMLEEVYRREMPIQRRL